MGTDRQLIERFGAMRVALVADVLDRLGYRRQVMSPAMRPRTQAETFVGVAFPVSVLPVDSIDDEPYEREIAAIDAVPEGGVLVMAAPGCAEVGIWGELLATRATQRGGVGAVIDGGIRDILGLREMGFAVFSTSVSANDSRGRSNVVSQGEPIECAGVAVALGDVVLADPDGVVVVPAAVASAAAADAAEKDRKEALAREMLQGGASVADVWQRHRVL